PQEPEENLQQRALARPVRAGQRHEFSFADVHVEVLEEHAPSEPDPERASREELPPRRHGAHLAAAGSPRALRIASAFLRCIARRSGASLVALGWCAISTGVAPISLVSDWTGADGWNVSYRTAFTLAADARSFSSA